MLKSPLCIGFATLALCIVPQTLVVNSAALNAAPRESGDALHCVDFVDDYIMNTCSFKIVATWCVENYDCRDGHFVNQNGISPGGKYRVYGATEVNALQYGACIHPLAPINRGNYTFVCK